MNHTLLGISLIGPSCPVYCRWKHWRSLQALSAFKWKVPNLVCSIMLSRVRSASTHALFILDIGAVFFFAGVDGVKWKKPVVPGDTLVMEVEIKKWNKRFGIATAVGRAYVDGEMAVELDEM